MSEDRKQSTRQILYQGSGGVARLGIYVNESSGKLFHGSIYGDDYATNRVIPDRVWIDEEGYICVDADRRNLNTNK